MTESMSTDQLEFFKNRKVLDKGRPEALFGEITLLVNERNLLVAEVERLRGACNTADFKCLTGEYCAGCEARDIAELEVSIERDLLRQNQDDHETDLRDMEREHAERCASFVEAIETLHTQAHGTDIGMYVCPLDPCRGVYRLLPNPAEAVSS